jgi:hypothetical protein
MSAPDNECSQPEPIPGSSANEFELPTAPTFPAAPPLGSFEDRWQLSLLALEAVKDRPESLARREVQRVDTEFVM